MNFTELLRSYDFDINGSHNHWYRFKFTNCISIMYYDVPVLVNERFKIIKKFETVETLKNFLDGMFNS